VAYNAISEESPKDKKKLGSLLRTLDMKSPRLVSHSLYEAIRLTEICIIDWSEWRSNVFFELGVRLSAVNNNPVCIIDEESYSKEHQNIQYQVSKLLEIFEPIRYNSKGRISEKDKESYKRMLKKDETLSNNFIYETVSQYFDISVEVNSMPIYTKLIKEADRFLEDESIGLSSLLYPTNRELKESLKKNTIHTQLSAWYFMTHYYKAELKTNSKLRKEYIQLGDLLSSTLFDSDNEKDKLISEEIYLEIEEYNKLGE
jgi:hypothetical protein